MFPVGAVHVADAVAFNASPSTAANAVKYDESVCPLPFAGGAGTLNVPVTDAEAPGASVARTDLLLELNWSGAVPSGGWIVTAMLEMVADGPPPKKSPEKSTLTIVGWTTFGLAGVTSRWKLLRTLFTFVGSTRDAACDGVSGTFAGAGRGGVPPGPALVAGGAGRGEWGRGDRLGKRGWDGRDGGAP